MSEQTITLEDRGSHACITLNRPEAGNRLNPEMLDALQRILRDCAGRFPVIILTGAGASFCAGRDADETPAASAQQKDGRIFARQGHQWIETMEMIRKHPAVFIAMVNGAALGDGVALINVCDLAIVDENAEIGTPDIARAEYPAVAGPTTQLRILRKHASWLILTGKSIDGKTAAKWGLVNAAVPGEQLAQETRDVAEGIAKFNPVTIDYSRKALDDIPAHLSDWTTALEYGRLITTVGQNQIGKENFMPKKF